MPETSELVHRLRVAPGTRPDLSKIDPREAFGWDKDGAKRRLRDAAERIGTLQARLYAEGTRSLLVVLQGMDAAGKDGTTRAVFEEANPQGVVVTSFKKPTSRELAQDYLWRAHRDTPPRGILGVWNRSHYEDVLVVRVKSLVPDAVWSRRYEHINAFEKLLTDEGTMVLKFFLHVSAEEQGERLAERLQDPAKAWKFNADDFDTRKHRTAYLHAYEDAMQRCSTDHAPWFVIPADRNWVRNLCVAEIVADALERMDPVLPRLRLSDEEIERYLREVE
jgi:PPK2 family polyphosphate:nucleotide phosphotransferase